MNENPRKNEQDNSDIDTELTRKFDNFLEKESKLHSHECGIYLSRRCWISGNEISITAKRS